MPTPVHDHRILRAIAHPVRARILDELTATGASRAADLAADLGIPANQASFHLRQLAKYGLVVEAPEAARDKRDRVWKPASPDGLAINPRELSADPAAAAATEVYLRSAEGRAHRLVSAAYRLPDDAPDVVRRASEDTLRLTDAEARELGEELGDLVERWHARTRGRDGDRHTHHLLTVLQPYPELTDETSASSAGSAPVSNSST